MITKIKKKIRNYIIKKMTSIVSEAQARNNTKEINNLKQQFKKVGESVFIDYPYRIVGAPHISVGDNFSSQINLRLEAIDSYYDQAFTPEIIIGNNVSIECNCHIGAINKIIIEDDVMIAGNVYISDHFHGKIVAEELHIPPMQRELSSKGPVIIHRNVWIGDSVCILPGVTIGENAIIGANAVVTKSIPANAVAAGTPAVVIKQY